MKLFKSGDDRFKEGNELIKMKDYDKARTSFTKAIKKGSSDSDLAEAMLALLDLKGNPGEAEYVNAYNIFNRIYNKDKESAVEFGLFVVSCSYLMIECGCMILEKRALSMPSNDLEARAKALFKAAENFKELMGENKLLTVEFYSSVEVTGVERANRLMAIGNEDLAESIVWMDPKKAAEHLLNAANFYRQIGDGDAEATVKNRISLYAKAATCWICGCEASGETIHFVSMETNVTDVLVKGKKESVLPSFADHSSIYVCRACYLAISNRADKIASEYHEIAMQEMSKMEVRLEDRIEDNLSMIHVLEKKIEDNASMIFELEQKIDKISYGN